MFIVIVKELNKEYLTSIKKFVYISLIIKLNFENPKLDKILEKNKKKKKKRKKKLNFKFMYVLVLVNL